MYHNRQRSGSHMDHKTGPLTAALIFFQVSLPYSVRERGEASHSPFFFVSRPRIVSELLPRVRQYHYDSQPGQCFQLQVDSAVSQPGGMTC